jgi:CheY-like chemotaxis protein
MEEIQTFPFVKALVVDDQENSCKYLEALLKKFSVETKITTGGQQAIQILSEAYAANKPFNLCLLDWKMPGMDGLTVAKKIKELNLKGLKVILVTSSDFNSITEEREELGITAMVNKPLFTATIFSILMENFSEEVAALNSSQPKFDFKGARVLVAEHNEITSELVVKLLEKVNFKVDKVTDGKDACEKFGTAEPRYYDAIIVDLDLPEIDGTEVAKIIRMSDHAEGQTIPIIALVDNVLSEDAAKAISCGMNSYVEKPIDKDKLYNTLSNLLR